MSWSFDAMSMLRACRNNLSACQDVLVTLWELNYPDKELLEGIWNEVGITETAAASGKSLAQYIQWLDTMK